MPEYERQMEYKDKETGEERKGGAAYMWDMSKACHGIICRVEERQILFVCSSSASFGGCEEPLTFST